jgi:hypothetical protein
MKKKRTGQARNKVFSFCDKQLAHTAYIEQMSLINKGL